MHLFRNYVDYHFKFPKIDKKGGGGGKKAEGGGLENFSKIDKWGGTIIRYLRALSICYCKNLKNNLLTDMNSILRSNRV